MPDIDFIRREIERMRTQVHRERGEISRMVNDPLFPSWKFGR